MKITINNQTYEAKPDQTIIEIADQHQIRIPRFCYHKGLSVASNCRMCLVDVEGAPKPLPACSTPAQDGMVLDTQSSKTKNAQKNVMQFLLINHPLDCPICDQGGECELQDVAMGFGNISSPYVEPKRVAQNKNIGPLIQTEMTRCIHCTRCVRFGEEIAGQKEMGAPGRGEHTAITTFIENTIDSELSGNMIDLCPVGALTSKPFRYNARAWEMQAKPSIAIHDIVGSHIEAHCKDGIIERIVPRYNPAINDYWLSDRDRFSYQGIYSQNRLEQPKIKIDNQWQHVTWEAAFEHVKTRMLTLTPDERTQTTGLAGPSLTLEEYYLFQKFIRGLGSNCIDYRLGHSGGAEHPLINKIPVLGQSLESLENCQFIWLIGGFVQKQQPMISQRIKRAAQKGAKVFSLDVQAHNYTYPVKQITLAPSHWLGFCECILSNLKDGSNTQLEASDHHAPEVIIQSLIASIKQAGKHGTLLLAGDAMSSQNSYPLHQTLQTTAELTQIHMGYLPNQGGAISAHVAGCVPFYTPTTALQAMTADDKQPVCSLESPTYCLLNVDPQHDTAYPADLIEKLEKAQFVVSITSYEHPTLQQCADVLLPCGTQFETPGTHVNTAAEFQKFEQISKNYEQSRPLWKILRVLGSDITMHDFNYEYFSDVQQEVENCALLDSACTKNKPDTEITINPQKPQTSDTIEVWLPTTLYSVDAVLREASALQNTQDGRCDHALIHPQTLKHHGLESERVISLSQDDRVYEVMLQTSEKVALGCIVIWNRQQKSHIQGSCHGFYTIDKHQK